MNHEQTLKQWGQLVAEIPVTNLKQIQDVTFTKKLLTQLDPEYFTKSFSLYSQDPTFSQLFTQIANYYAKQIGTNIKHIMGEDVNIYSTNTIQQIWQLVLGIAIKGRNRQSNINTILKMRTQTQEELMRIISKLINNLGENVSVIDSSVSQIVNETTNISSNDTELIIQLSEQNEQLRQKMEQQSTLISSLKQRNKALEIEAQQRNQQKKRLIDVITRESMSSKINFSSSSAGSDLVMDFIKDMISQIGSLSRQLNKREERQQYLEDVNRDLKVAYSTAVMDFEKLKKVTSETHIDVGEIQKEIQELRNQNLEYASREKDFVTKIGDLQQQKFYLKDIVQRLQSQKAISQQKIEQILSSNKVVSAKIVEEEPEQIKATNSLLQPQSPQKKAQRLTTMRNEIDETRNPNYRNKLQKQVSHLQKKVNTLQQQNTSLRKINGVLQNVINNFTKQNSESIKKHKTQMDPILRQFEETIQNERKGKRDAQQQLAANESNYQQKIKNILNKMRQTINQYNIRQFEFQKIIKKLQFERDQLLKTIKVFDEQPPKVKIQIIQKEVVAQKYKPKLGQQKNVQFSAIAYAPQKQNLHEAQEQKQQQRSRQTYTYRIKSSIQEPLQQQEAIQKIEPSSVITGEDKKLNKKTIIIEDQQIEDNSKQNKYSFMENRKSYFNEQELNMTQKVPNMNRVDSFGSQIYQNVQPNKEKDQVNVMSTVQIIDITQIQQQLIKIREHYLELSQQNYKICQQYLKNNNKNNLKTIIDEFEDKHLQIQNENSIKTEDYLKQFQQTGILSSKSLTENIKLKQQNNILKSKLVLLHKQSQSIMRKLATFQQQSGKSQQQRTKNELVRLNNLFSEIRQIMVLTESNFSQLKNEIVRFKDQNAGKYQQLNLQIVELRQNIKQRDFTVRQLELQCNLLMSAVLEFRNGALPSYF